MLKDLYVLAVFVAAVTAIICVCYEIDQRGRQVDRIEQKLDLIISFHQPE